MIPEKAIEKAIEGGYAKGYKYRGSKEEVGSWKAINNRYLFIAQEDITPEQYKGYSVILCSAQEIALDPTFWQALGKELGWGDLCGGCGAPLVFTSTYWHCLEVHEQQRSRPPDWISYAQRFYDLILTSGDAEAFWNELLGE